MAVKPPRQLRQWVSSGADFSDGIVQWDSNDVCSGIPFNTPPPLGALLNLRVCEAYSYILIDA